MRSNPLSLRITCSHNHAATGWSSSVAPGRVSNPPYMNRDPAGPMLLTVAGTDFPQPRGERCLCLSVILGPLMLYQIANDLDALVDRQPGRVQYNVEQQCIVPIEVERSAHRT